MPSRLGVWLQVCVQTSMREANDRGYESLLVTDATASYIPAFKEATIAMITAQVCGGALLRSARVWYTCPQCSKLACIAWGEAAFQQHPSAFREGSVSCHHSLFCSTLTQHKLGFRCRAALSAGRQTRWQWRRRSRPAASDSTQHK